MDAASQLALTLDPSKILRAQDMTPDPWQRDLFVVTAFIRSGPDESGRYEPHAKRPTDPQERRQALKVRVNIRILNYPIPFVLRALS